jgi:phosphoribosylaminoimidazolecarboxamide formyltransferase/IMP cyclohydrolase
MNGNRKIQSALISVFHKERLDEIVKKLQDLNIKIYSTGGTYDFITNLGIKAVPVENITAYPSILGGRVKTLHPKIFGGILYRRENPEDIEQVKQFEIPDIDLVIVDLYPFEKTVAAGAEEDEIIEKIDIGGISLIRAAAKNFNDVIIIPSSCQYDDLIELLNTKEGFSDIDDRKHFAAHAFNVSSHYDSAIFNYFNKNKVIPALKISVSEKEILRYGENPHQEGAFYGKTSEVFDQLNGKQISYNNLVDIEAAMNLVGDFSKTTVAIIKHTNACGIASRENLLDAWNDALAGDPVSAFGGVIAVNKIIDNETAEEINKLFFEVLIAPSFENNALELLKNKKNRIILQQKMFSFPEMQFKSLLNGVIEQTKDFKVETEECFNYVTDLKPSATEVGDLLFANKVVKHTKSNTIVLAKNEQLFASGVGQTSRVDALKQAIIKAGEFGFDLKGAVMASDAFFPFADCVEIAAKAGITAVIQPGGSIRDKDSIDYCNNNNIAMVLTGFRHFKH